MHGLSSVALVGAMLAVTLGRGVVNAPLAPELVSLAEPAASRRPVDAVYGMGVLDEAIGSRDRDLAEPASLPTSRDARPASADFSGVRATGPWISPLYPQNGVTVWDRIRVSSQRDCRAF